jgi:hypothetical protein
MSSAAPPACDIQVRNVSCRCYHSFVEGPVGVWEKRIGARGRTGIMVCDSHSLSNVVPWQRLACHTGDWSSHKYVQLPVSFF